MWPWLHGPPSHPKHGGKPNKSLRVARRDFGNMARAATTNDVFNAIAEARRRNILAFLRGGESWAVNKVVARLGLGQVTVSKHLAVLRKIGVVEISKEGRYRGYRLRPEGFKPIMVGHGGLGRCRRGGWSLCPISQGVEGAGADLVTSRRRILECDLVATLG